MENLENVTNEIELYDVESNGILDPEDVDGELANGEEEEVDFPDNGDNNEEVSISPTPRTSLLLGVNRSQYNINVRSGAGTEMPLSAYSVGQDYARISYAYIDTQMKHGASHVKWNW